MMSGDLKVKGWRGKWGQQCADRQGKTCVCLCVCVKGSLRRLRGVYMESPSCLELRSFYFPSSLPFSCLSERELTRITVCVNIVQLCLHLSVCSHFMWLVAASHVSLTICTTRVQNISHWPLAKQEVLDLDCKKNGKAYDRFFLLFHIFERKSLIILLYSCQTWDVKALFSTVKLNSSPDQCQMCWYHSCGKHDRM